MYRRVLIALLIVVLLTAAPAFASGSGAGGFFFPFFDWITEAFDVMRNWFAAVVDHVVGGVVSIAELFTGFFFESVVAILSYLQEGINALIVTSAGAAEATIGRAFGLISAILNLPVAFMEFVLGLLDRVFAAMLNAVLSFVPDNWSLAATGPGYISVIVSLANYLGVFVDYGFILGCAGTTGVTVAGLETAKIVWRCIPGVG